MHVLRRFATFLIIVAPLVSAQETKLSVVEATWREVRQEIVLDGVAEAVSHATVTAQTSGRVIELNFDVDDYVAKGDVIVRLDNTEQKARFDQANANLQESKANLRDAQLVFDRAKRLLKQNHISESEFDQAEAELNAANARVDASQARLREAREQLDYTVVRAPFSGIVTQRHIEPGEIAAVGGPLMTGLSLEKLRVNVDVPQTFIDAVRERPVARVVIPNEVDRSIDSSQLTIFPYADPHTHTFRVRVQLPENLSGVNPGMFVKVVFIVDMVKRLLIPQRAIAYRSEVSAVYVVDDQGQIEMRQVRLGQRYDGQIEILAGLTAGERVALEPVKAAIELKQGDRESTP